MEFYEKIQKALIVIEKLEGKLTDDTYLDKAVSGIQEQLQQVPNQIEFLEDSGIDAFCNKHFENAQLNEFVWRLCNVCQDRNWLQKWQEKMKNFKKIWPLESIALLQLLQSICKCLQDEDFLQMTWRHILARILHTNHVQKSHFWKKEGGELLVIFLTLLCCKSCNNLHDLQLQVAQVLQQSLVNQNEFCNKALLQVLQNVKSEEEIQWLNLQKVDNFQIKLGICIICKQKSAPETLLQDNFQVISDQEWIQSLQMLPMLNSNLIDNCIKLAEKDHKFIGKMIQLKNETLNLQLLKFIERILQEFLPTENEQKRTLINAGDSKLFHSCLSNLVSLAKKSNVTFEENQLELFIKLTMIAEMEAKTRSLVIHLLSTLIEADKCPKSWKSLELWASKCWHLFRYKDWECTDAMLCLISSDNLTTELKSVPQTFIDVFLGKFLFHSRNLLGYSPV